MDSVKVILDENINVGADRAKLLRVNGTQITYNAPQNNGSIVGGQILFSNITLPSLANSVISRNMRVRYQVAITATTIGTSFANAATQEYALAPNIALRPFPLSTCTDTAILTINNVPVAVSLRQMMPAIIRTIPKAYLEKEASECPSMLDNLPIIVSDQIDTVGVSNQPLSNAINCSYQTTRGSFLPISAVVSGTNTITTFEVCEPIFVSPLSLYDDKTFLANVNTLSYQINYSLLGDMCTLGAQVSNGSLNYPAAYSVALVDNTARLEYTVISLDSRVVAIPRVVSYDYAMPQFFPTPLTLVPTSLASLTITSTGMATSQSLRLSYMPSLIYIYANIGPNSRASGAVAGASAYSDCTLAIGSASGTYNAGTGVSDTVQYNTNQQNVISIQLNNRQGLLAGASIKDLYRIACTNGYQYPYSYWLMNPVIIVNPTKDLGLDLSASDIYPNQNGNVTLSIQAQFNTWNYCTATNMYLTGAVAPPWSKLTTPLEFMVVCVQEGIAELSPDTLVINTGALSASEVKQSIEEASSGGDLDTAFVPSSVAKAGGGSLASMFGAAPSVISGIAKGVGSVINDPLFKMALSRAQGLGGGVSAGGYSGGGVSAGGVSAGRVRRRR